LPNLKDRVDEVNKLFTYCNQNNWNYIWHKNIGVNDLNTYGLHLNSLGTATLARNILLYLNSDRKYNWNYIAPENLNNISKISESGRYADLGSSKPGVEKIFYFLGPQCKVGKFSVSCQHNSCII
jgi:hypothetical protein